MPHPHPPSLDRRQFLGTSAASAAACAWPRPAQAQAIAGAFVGPSPQRGHWLQSPAQLPPWANAAPGPRRRVGVLVAGGGVAGLAAARALRLRGMHDLALLELHDSAGGNSIASAMPLGGPGAGRQPCPLGAHYLPVPGPGTPELQDLLHEFGLLERTVGRVGGGYRVSALGERHLCHSPQERLFFNGAWQAGLLPLAGVGAATLAQYRRFAQAVQTAQQQVKFTIPISNQPLAKGLLALDAITFDAWLAQQGLQDAHLRWYLGYCCRDEYGAGTGIVSAYAGIAYFAARHGFSAPGEALLPGLTPGEALISGLAPGEAAASPGLFTWPEGNSWLTQRLAAPLGQRLHTGRVITRIAEGRGGVEVDALNVSAQTTERWLAAHCIVALPLRVAARVVQLRSSQQQRGLQAAAASLRSAPWLVANLVLSGALHERGGAAPSWDNVLYGAAGLGYVNARHQQLEAQPARNAAGVLTYYRALGDVPGAARQLLTQPLPWWQAQVLADLAPAHADLPGKLLQMDVCRWGHGMAIPLPATLLQRQKYSDSGLLPARNLPRPLSKKISSAATNANSANSASSAPLQRLTFAHSDWAGYSVFEEAFALGHRAGMAALAG
ncbi:MAG: NAD(P)-binding protein [Burkholderiaceae bacterium]